LNSGNRRNVINTPVSSGCAVILAALSSSRNLSPVPERLKLRFLATRKVLVNPEFVDPARLPPMFKS
jgi:hypothetical protein